MNQVLKQFTEFSFIYDQFKPLTPYGKSGKRSLKFYTDRSELENQLDKVELLLKLVEKYDHKANRIEYHLKRVLEINSLSKEYFDSTDLFLIKKFLINVKAVYKLIGDDLAKTFNLNFNLDHLIELLSAGNYKSEVFHLDSSYDPKLVEIREDIAEFDKGIATLKRSILQDILDKTGYDFRFTDFIVIDESSVNRDSKQIYIEPYDNRNVVIKPIFTDEYSDLRKKRETFVTEEFKIEERVLRSISADIKKDRESIEKLIESITDLDLILAKGRVAHTYKMCRGEISETYRLSIDGGRLLSLESRLEDGETKYTPLNCKFDSSVSVVTGSNMGGKTVLLKTIGFLQLMFQYGFFIPANSFKGSLFKHIEFIGEREFKLAGLSSFGFEIFSFNNGVEEFNRENTLLLIDEFARTTNSVEAKALTMAVIKRVSETENYKALFSTHFMKLDKFENVDFFRMKGLQRDSLKSTFNKQFYTLEDRLNLINSLMSYEVVENPEQELSYDALNIAETLGMDSIILEYAREYLDKE